MPGKKLTELEVNELVAEYEKALNNPAGKDWIGKKHDLYLKSFRNLLNILSEFKDEVLFISFGAGTGDKTQQRMPSYLSNILEEGYSGSVILIDCEFTPKIMQQFEDEFKLKKDNEVTYALKNFKINKLQLWFPEEVEDTPNFFAYFEDRLKNILAKQNNIYIANHFSKKTEDIQPVWDIYQKLKQEPANKDLLQLYSQCGASKVFYENKEYDAIENLAELEEFGANFKRSFDFH